MNPSPKATAADLLAQQGLKQAKNDHAWDWLRDISDNVRNYMSSPAVLLPMLGDDRLKSTIIGQGKVAKLTELCQRLGGDVKTYTTRFQVIHNKHAQRRGSSYNPEEMMTTIEISQDYMQFMSSYESVVMPTILEILEIFSQAGLDTSSVRALTNGQLVYDLYEAAPSPSGE